MSNKYIKAFLKFSKKKGYQDDLLDGKLFFRSVKGARKVNDPFDSYCSTVKTDFFNIRLQNFEDSIKPISCYYAVMGDNDSGIVDLKFSEEQLKKFKENFGEYVTVIKDAPRFIEQVKQTNLRIWYGCCDYTNDDIPSIALFNKKVDLSDEKEFRLVADEFVFAHDVDGTSLTEDENELDPNYYKNFYVLDKMLFVNIGNISDISETYSLNQLADGVKLQVKFDKERNTPEKLSNLKEYAEQYL